MKSEAMMFFFKRYKIRTYEMDLYFRNGEFRGLVEAGTRWLFDPLYKVRVDVVSQRDPWLTHEKLDLIVQSGEEKREERRPPPRPDPSGRLQRHSPIARPRR